MNSYNKICTIFYDLDITNHLHGLSLLNWQPESSRYIYIFCRKSLLIVLIISQSFHHFNISSLRIKRSLPASNYQIPVELIKRQISYILPFFVAVCFSNSSDLTVSIYQSLFSPDNLSSNSECLPYMTYSLT